MLTIFTDRSRVLRYQQCPRARWYEYHHGGLGIVPRTLQIELDVGAAVHAGVARLLAGDGVEAAVAASLDAVQTDSPEQRALTEALVRVHALRLLPALIADYEVLEIEREDLMELAETDGMRIVWMSRPDALLRSRSTGDLFVYSLKTASTFDRRRDDENRHDVQGMSEIAALERRLGERIQGVLMHFLVKGRRDENGQDSFLVRPWRRAEQFSDSWAWNPRKPCENPASCPYHSVRRSDEPYHNLRGYERVAVWEHMPVARWIDMLACGEAVPGGDPLAQVAVAPIPYFRNSNEIRRWLLQTASQELRVAADVLAVDGPNELDRRFPQYRRSCDWPRRCVYQDLCFGPEGAELRWEEFGYVPRRPHHEAERSRAMP